MRIKTLTYCISALLVLLISFATAAQTVGTLYQSQYISEGRDNLEAGGILWLTAASPIYTYSDESSFDIAVEYGNATQTDYDELLVTLSYTQQWADFELLIGASRLEFFQDAEFDNELSVSISTARFFNLTTRLDSVYSTQQNGSFFTLSASKEFRLHDQLVISPYIAASWDAGYATAENDSYNHTSFGSALTYALSPQLNVNLQVQFDLAGADIRRQQTNTGNQTWGSLALDYQF